MTTPPNAPAPQTSHGGVWMSRYGYWFLAVLMMLVLAFNILEQLFLDTDEADARYIHVAVSAEHFNSPAPGAVYVYNHRDQAFTKSQACALQYFETYGEEPRVLHASNILGLSVNATVSQVENVFGQTIAQVVTVDRPAHQWSFVKKHRPKSNAPLDASCFEVVMQYVMDPNTTPFIVDTTYIDTSDEGASPRWVALAPPVIFDPATCTDDTCPQPKSVREVVDDLSNPFTRMKAGWNIITFEGPKYETVADGS